MEDQTDQGGGSPASSPELDFALVDLLKEAASPRRLARGETLIEEGTASDALYFVVAGRFTVFSKGKAFAEIGPGEPVGEIAFFGGGARSATVVAACASDVLELSRDVYDEVLAREPGLSTAIIAVLAQRLRRTLPTSARLRPRPAQTIGIVPGGPGPLDADVVAPLIDALRSGGAHVLTGRDELGAGRALDDLALHSSAGSCIAVLCSDPESDPEWAEAVYQQCDTMVVCLDRSDKASVQPSRLEEKIAEGVLSQNIHLVLARPQGAPVTGSVEWLTPRKYGLHHHLEMQSRTDAARIARLVRGEGLGVVFGGGGAFGTAHLAILKALGEFGVEIDMVGGTSVGAAMAGAFAMGLSMDEVIDRFVEMFVKSGAATRVTLPVWSIMDHTHFDAQLKHHYGASLMAEDLGINYYALATSLTRNEPVILRRGPLWRLIRASSAIPAVFPPMIMDDGEVLVDGGLFDNVPVSAMRALKPGPNLVLRLASDARWRVNADYDALPGRFGAIRRLLPFGRSGKTRFPGISSIMTRSLIVNSQRLQATVDRGGDIFLDLPRIRGMGFMQWSKGRDLYEKTYAETAGRLEKLSAQHTGLDLLRALAERETPRS